MPVRSAGGALPVVLHIMRNRSALVPQASESMLGIDLSHSSQRVQAACRHRCSARHGHRNVRNHQWPLCRMGAVRCPSAACLHFASFRSCCGRHAMSTRNAGPDSFVASCVAMRSLAVQMAHKAKCYPFRPSLCGIVMQNGQPCAPRRALTQPKQVQGAVRAFRTATVRCSTRSKAHRLRRDVRDRAACRHRHWRHYR